MHGSSSPTSLTITALPCFTKLQPRSSVLRVCKVLSEGKFFTCFASNLFLWLFTCKNQTNCISFSDCENHTPSSSETQENFFPCFVYLFEQPAALRQQEQPFLFPPSQFSAALGMATLEKARMGFPRKSVFFLLGQF